MKAQEGKTYALIQNAQVAQIFTKNELSEWNEQDLEVKELTTDELAWVKVGTQVDSLTRAFIKPDLSAQKREKLQEININFEYECDSIKGEYIPSDELLTWSVQESEARAYLASKVVSSCPLLAALAQARGINLDSLCQKVLEKSAKYSTAIALLVGNRQMLQDKIQKAKNEQELAKIVYVSPLAALK